jgi:hypothetical protein
MRWISTVGLPDQLAELRLACHKPVDAAHAQPRQQNKNDAQHPTVSRAVTSSASASSGIGNFFVIPRPPP